MRGTQAFALLLAVFGPIFGSGCEDSPESLPSGKRTPTDARPSVVKPLLDAFPTPAFALILSGEQHGYLEPCGCSDTQSGGVARRLDLIRKVEARGWPVAGLDLGGTLKRSNAQSQIKFDAILAAMKGMNYRALGLGPEELQLDPTELLSRHATGDDPDKSLSFVSANVTLFGSIDIGTPVRFRTFDVGGFKVTVTSVVSKSETRHVPYLQDEATMTLDDPAAALEAVRGAIEAEDAELRVLLAYCSLEETKALAKEFPEYELVVSAGGPEDPDGKPIAVGRTTIVQVGHKGKYVGVCAVYPDTYERLRFELVNLDQARFENAPEMTDVMRAYQDRLKNEQIIENDSEISHSTGHAFVGVKQCAECHTKSFAVWEKTKHAHAYESLVKGREGQEANWVSRIYDPECIACHTTGWKPQEVLRYKSGFVSADATPHLLGQQCENCHGPGSHHTQLERSFKDDAKSVDAEELKQGRIEMQLTKVVAVKRVCYNCHDLDNSPHFDFEKYWEKIKHVGRD